MVVDKIIRKHKLNMTFLSESIQMPLSTFRSKINKKIPNKFSENEEKRLRRAMIANAKRVINDTKGNDTEIE